MKRRIRALIALVALLLGGLLAGPASVVAAPSAAAPTNCDSTAYPPSVNATIELDTNDIIVGETVNISGVGFCANESVRISVADRALASAHTDGQGAFESPVPVKLAVPGLIPVHADGASGLDSDRASDTVAVRDPAVAGEVVAPAAASPGAGAQLGGGGVAHAATGGDAAGDGVATHTESESSSPLASTGVKIAGAVVLAMLLLAGGVLLQRSGRQRRARTQ